MAKKPPKVNLDEKEQKQLQKDVAAQKRTADNIKELKEAKKKIEEINKLKEEGYEIDEKELKLLEKKYGLLEDIDKKLKKQVGNWNKIEQRVKKTEDSISGLGDQLGDIFGSKFSGMFKGLKGAISAFKPNKMNDAGDMVSPMQDAFDGFGKELKNVFSQFGKDQKAAAKEETKATKQRVKSDKATTAKATKNAKTTAKATTKATKTKVKPTVKTKSTKAVKPVKTTTRVRTGRKTETTSIPTPKTKVTTKGKTVTPKTRTAVKPVTRGKTSTTTTGDQNLSGFGGMSKRDLAWAKKLGVKPGKKGKKTVSNKKIGGKSFSGAQRLSGFAGKKEQEAAYREKFGSNKRSSSQRVARQTTTPKQSVPPPAPPTPPAGGGGAIPAPKGGGFGKALGGVKNVAGGVVKGLGGAGKALASLGAKAIPVVGQVMAVVDALKMVGGAFKDGSVAVGAFVLGMDEFAKDMGRLTDEYRDMVIDQKIVEPVRQKQQDESDVLGYQQSVRADQLQYNQDIEKENLSIKQGYAKEDLQFQQGLIKDRVGFERSKEDDLTEFGFSLVQDQMQMEKSMAADAINFQFQQKMERANHAHQQAMQDMQAEFNLRKAFFMAGMKDQQKLIGVSARALEAAGSSGQEVIQTAQGLATSMGLGLNQGIKLGTTVSLISKRLGIGTEEVGKIGEAFRLIGGLSAEQALNLQTSTAAMAKANGLNPQAVMKEMASAAEDAYSFNVQSAEALAEQVTALSAIGVSYSKIAKAGKSMVLNYKDSIKAEMQLSSMLGEQVDLSEARAAFASGDVAGGTAALQASLGDIDINSLDMFQKEALSQSLGGMDISEIMKVGGGKDKEGFGPEKNMADATAKFSGAVTQFKTDATQIGKDIANGALAMDKGQAAAELAASQAHAKKMFEAEQAHKAGMMAFEQQWRMKELLFEQDKREYMLGIEQKRRYEDMMMERDFTLETVELERLQRLETLSLDQKQRQETLMLRAQERREASDLRFKQSEEMMNTKNEAKAYGSWFNRVNPFSNYNLNVQSTTQTAGMSSFSGFDPKAMQSLQGAGVNLNMNQNKNVHQQDKEYWDAKGPMGKLEKFYKSYTGQTLVGDMFGVAEGQFQDLNKLTAYQGNIGAKGSYASGFGGNTQGAGSYQMMGGAPGGRRAASDNMFRYASMTGGMPGGMASQNPMEAFNTGQAADAFFARMGNTMSAMPGGPAFTGAQTLKQRTGIPYEGAMLSSMDYGMKAWEQIKNMQLNIPSLSGAKAPEVPEMGKKAIAGISGYQGLNPQQMDIMLNQQDGFYTAMMMMQEKQGGMSLDEMYRFSSMTGMSVQDAMMFMTQETADGLGALSGIGEAKFGELVDKNKYFNTISNKQLEKFAKDAGISIEKAMEITKAKKVGVVDPVDPLKPIKAVGKFLVDGVKNTVSGIKKTAGVVADGWKWMYDTGKKGLEPLKNTGKYLIDAGKGAIDWAKGAWETIRTDQGGMWEGTKKVAAQAWDSTKKWAANAWNNTKTWAAGAWNNMKSTAAKAWESTKTWAAKAWENTKTWAANAWENTKTWAANSWENVTTKTAQIIEGTKLWAANAWESTKTWAAGAWDGIKTTTAEAWEATKTWAAESWDSVKTWAATSWDSIKSWASGAWENVKGWASGAWDSVASTASGAWESVKGWASGAWDSITSTASGAWDGIKSAASGVWDWFTGGSDDKKTTTTAAPAAGGAGSNAILTLIQQQADTRGIVIAGKMDTLNASLQNLITHVAAGYNNQFSVMNTTLTEISGKLGGEKASSGPMSSPWDPKMFDKLVYISGNIERLVARNDKLIVNSDIQKAREAEISKNQATSNTHLTELVKINRNLQALMAVIVEDQGSASSLVQLDGAKVGALIQKRQDARKNQNPELK